MNKTLLLLLLPIFLFAQNYLWPTNASKFLTSSFCEYRPGHYHSAIDIKTWNTEGYRIFAIEEGRIERIRISPFGYGKVLYLKLNDGRTAVYAHLQRFNKKLEKAIREQQHRKKRYSISWKPENWIVSRGEILGYTGQTGIGVPHLHFEIRDKKGHPLNPLHFYNVIQDHIPPKLQSLLVTPLDVNSLVNSSFDQQQFDLKRTNNNTYLIKKTIRGHGKIGLALKSYDKADKIYNRFAFYRTTLEVDGKKVFQIQYDTLDFDLTGQIEIEIDYPVYKQTKKRYNKLYIEPFNHLPFYKRDLGDGILQLKYDTVQFKIEVSDFEGNKSTVLGTLLPDASAAIQIHSLQPRNNNLLLELQLPKQLQGLQFFSRVDNQDWTDIKYFEILNQQFNANNQELIFKIQMPQTDVGALKIKAFLPNGLVGEKTINWTVQDSTPTQLSISNRGKYLHVKTIPEQSLASIIIESNINEQAYPQNLNFLSEAVIPARALQGDSLQFHFQRNLSSVQDSSFSFYVLNPGKIEDFSFFENRYRLQSQPNSVYDTLLFQVTEKTLQAYSFTAPVLSKAFALNGQQQVLKGTLNLSIKYDSLHFPARQIGLSRLRGKGKLSWQKTLWDSTRQTFSSRISGFGHYLLCADTTAPIVEIESPVQNEVSNKFKEIRFTMDDSLSGIGTDRNIKILLDDQFIIPEWDPERNLVTGKPDYKLRQGNHLLKIRVLDEAGNVTEKRVQFKTTTYP